MQWWRQSEVLLVRRTRLCLLALMVVQVSLLSWIAFENSPVTDEIAHLPAGLSHWRYQRFDLYRVNPPLVRCVAAIPVLFSGCAEDWHAYQSAPLEREEFAVGRAFVSANGFGFFHYVSIARMACIPFSLLGTVVCFVWARALSGRLAGLFAAALWVVSPNVLAHGALITPDVAAASTGLLSAYTFWKWLECPRWSHAIFAGISLGLAELSKSTWLILFGLWPAICFISILVSGDRTSWCRKIVQLTALLLTGLYVLNAGYLFEGSMKSLGDYQFRSRTLAGGVLDPDRTIPSGNRFADTMLQSLPVPLPQAYVEGIDLQKLDFEIGQPSYLRGVWRDRGWWHYYVYALSVKLPLGTLVLAVCMILHRVVSRRSRSESWTTTLVLTLPPLCVLILVSLQTGFNKHLRYVLPVLPFVFVGIGMTVGRLRTRRSRCLRPACFLILLWITFSSLRFCPVSLVYFNELAGGPANGHKHLLGSNLDWGQSLIALNRWDEQRQDGLPLYVSYSGLFDPADVGIACSPLPLADGLPAPGWYALSVNRLYGAEKLPAYFREHPPDKVLDYSMAVFRVR